VLVRENGGTGTKSMFKMLKIDDAEGSRYFTGLNGPGVVHLFTSTYKYNNVIMFILLIDQLFKRNGSRALTAEIRRISLVFAALF
jgi:hypothetical protein